jgi:hypothetical protein
MKDLKGFIKTTIREFMNEEVQNYEIVYRGQPPNVEDISPRNSIWVTYNYHFASVYGNVKKYKLPKNLNILDTYYYSEWETLVNEFDENGDYDEYKYHPTDEFIQFLISKGYNGFMNGDNILIFDKSILEIL